MVVHNIILKTRLNDRIRKIVKYERDFLNDNALELTKDSRFKKLQEQFEKRRVAFLIFGLVTLVIGIVLYSIPWADYLILRQLRIWNGSLSFHYWQKPGVLRLTKVYIFNVTNPDTFLNYGEKPKLQEIGPFVYREDMEKENIHFHNNGTVSFQHKKYLNFVPELSANKYEKITVPNIPLLALAAQSNTFGYFVQKTISVMLAMGKYTPFVSLTVEDLIFGYDDPIVKLAHNFYPKHKRPQKRIGLLIGRNGTVHDTQTIFTGEGENGMKNFGIMERLNGRDKLPYWPDSPCNNLRGSEGSFFPPRYFTKEDILYVYDRDLCRILPIQYTETTSKHGITVDLYTLRKDVYDTADINIDNKCFCPGHQICPPRGFQNIGPCHFDAPLYLSHPHLMGVDASISNQIDGMRPDPIAHKTFFKIQPKLGTPLEAKVRVQINLKVDRVPNIAAAAKFPNIIFPIMWLEEGVSDLTPPIRRWMYFATTFCDVIGPFLTYGCMFIGSCILIAIFVNTYKSIVFTKETIGMGMKTLRRSSTYISGNNTSKLLIVRDSYALLPELQSANA